MHCVQVLINLPTTRMDKYLTYRVPARLDEQVLLGKRVLVHLGSKLREGYVVAEDAPDVGQAALKPILQILDPHPVIDHAMLNLARWMADSYLCPLSTALYAILPRPLRHKKGRMVVPLAEPEMVSLAEMEHDVARVMHRLWDAGPIPYQQALRLAGEDELEKLQLQGMITLSGYYHMKPPKTEQYYVLGDIDAEEMENRLSQKAPRQAQALRVCRQRGIIEASVLEKLVPRASLRALLNKGYLRLSAPPSQHLSSSLALSAEQQTALTALEPQLKKKQFGVSLLHGVTASGKTEIYMQAIQKTLDSGRQAIMMVPEIALTRHLQQLYQARFAGLAVLHSQMADGERYQSWQRVKAGQAEVVLGTRSAVFAPLPRPGLFILDEEHETTYKQEETPRYHAREVALFRAKQEGATVILGSATPSLESYYRAVKGEFGLLSMPERIAPARQPTVRIIDMRQNFRHDTQGAISAQLTQAIHERLERGEQTILFLNRRGYAPVTICRCCGQSIMCPHCAVSLTYHRDSDSYLCHYCDYRQEVPHNCPSCGMPGLHPLGSGTQKIEEEVGRLFPQARIGRLDMDSSRRKGIQNKILDSMQNRQMDILIGTQMVAKGLDYPGVSLVGVVDADILLHLPDFRAYERTMQLIVQAAGRAGRGQDRGEVLIQTYNPEHEVIAWAARYDYKGFYQAEIEARRLLQYPPYVHIMRIVIWDEQEGRGQLIAADIFNRIYEIIDAKEDQIIILGPAPCPINRLRGKYRRQILVKAGNREMLGSIGRSLLELKYPPPVRIEIDIDPMSTL